MTLTPILETLTDMVDAHDAPSAKAMLKCVWLLVHLNAVDAQPEIETFPYKDETAIALVWTGKRFRVEITVSGDGKALLKFQPRGKYWEGFYPMDSWEDCAYYGTDIHAAIDHDR